MRFKNVSQVVAALIVTFVIVSYGAAQSPGYLISAPYSYKNLTIFLLHGKDQTSKSNVITLQEAMERNLFVVHETSSVNELEVENLSKELDVFIQSGDIVKGGKQDRVLAVSIIIPARSGRVKIEAFCVEAGRWKQRGDEDAKRFTSSNDRIVTKELKMAANAARSQQEIWRQVAEAQKRLSTSVGDSVTSTESGSSLQLSLENKKVTANINDYMRNLARIVEGKKDVIGYAMAVNGKINSADIYASNALFSKVWMKMLKASATEAVAESKGVRLADPVKPAAVRTMLEESERAGSRERAVASGGTRLITRENDENVMIESRDEKSKVVVHKSYVRKN